MRRMPSAWSSVSMSAERAADGLAGDGPVDPVAGPLAPVPRDAAGDPDGGAAGRVPVPAGPVPPGPCGPGVRVGPWDPAGTAA
jgi:hypothetical protein